MKKNIAKNIFIWSMIVLFAVAGGCFIAQMYIDFNNNNCVSADIPSSQFELINGFSSYCPNDNAYVADYDCYYFYNSYNNFGFTLGSANRVYSNGSYYQYLLTPYDGNSLSSGAVFNSYGYTSSFYFHESDLTFNNVPNSNLYLVKSGSYGAFYGVNNSSTFAGYTRDTNSSHYAVGCKYYLYSSNNIGYFNKFVGATIGVISVQDGYLIDNNFDFTNFTQFEDIFWNFEENGLFGSYYICSLFDDSYNRLTFIIQISNGPVSFSHNIYLMKNVFFNNSFNHDAIYDNGYNHGYDIGFDAGHSQGVLDANEYSFLGLIGAVVDAPIAAFTGLFNFSILGVNLKDFLAGLLTICIVIVVVRLILVK